MDHKSRIESSIEPAFGQKRLQDEEPDLSKSFLAVVRDRSVRRLIVLLCLVLSAWVAVHQLQCSLDLFVEQSSDVARDGEQLRINTDEASGSSGNQLRLLSTEAKKVPLEAHIMSKCPDAQRCIQQLVIPAMEKISDKVDFRLSFIGRLRDGSDAVECKHGPEECLGNEILLCAAHLYPTPILQLGYANCLIGDYKKIPDRDFVEQCALEHGLDFGKISECVSKDIEDGAKMLRASVQRTADANVVKSCTVRVNEQIWCIVDDGKWSGCEGGEASVGDLATDIEKEYKGLNPAT